MSRASARPAPWADQRKSTFPSSFRAASKRRGARAERRPRRPRPQDEATTPREATSEKRLDHAARTGSDLVEEAEIPAFAVDDRNRIVAWNDEAQAALGFSADEMMGRDAGQVIESRDAVGNYMCPDSCGLHAMARDGAAIEGYTVQLRSSGGDFVQFFNIVKVTRPRPGHYEIVFFLQPERRRQTDDALLERLLHRRWLQEQRPTATPPGAPALPLTARQREVLELLASGKSTAEIAETIHVSVHTVRNHMQNVLEKLGAHSQAEAVAKAIRAQLI